MPNPAHWRAAICGSPQGAWVRDLTEEHLLGTYQNAVGLRESALTVGYIQPVRGTKPISQEGDRVVLPAKRPLSQRVLGYPACAPQDSLTLINTEVDVLRGMECTSEEKNAVLEYRRDILNTIQAYERTPITSPEVALKMLSGTSATLRPLARKWLTYVLNERRERKLVPHPNGEDMTYQSVLSRKVPAVQRLLSEAPLPEHGKYLLLYGGGPDILSVSTVAAEIAQIMQAAPVADVLFWHLEKGKAPALYSLAKGLGDRGGVPVPFPNENLMMKARNEV